MAFTAQHEPPNIWNQMSYPTPRGPCAHKPSLMTPCCTCLRFMIHPQKASSSFDCDGCGHHASFHRLECREEELALAKRVNDRVQSSRGNGAHATAVGGGTGGFFGMLEGVLGGRDVGAGGGNGNGSVGRSIEAAVPGGFVFGAEDEGEGVGREKRVARKRRRVDVDNDLEFEEAVSGSETSEGTATALTVSTVTSVGSGSGSGRGARGGGGNGRRGKVAKRGLRTSGRGGG